MVTEKKIKMKTNTNYSRLFCYSIESSFEIHPAHFTLCRQVSSCCHKEKLHPAKNPPDSRKHILLHTHYNYNIFTLINGRDDLF